MDTHRVAALNTRLHVGPPLHDPLCVLHLAQPELLPGRWAHLTVDTSDSERNGETRANFCSDKSPDKWEDREKYIKEGFEGNRYPNCYVMETLDREAFMQTLLECVNRAEEVIASTPL